MTSQHEIAAVAAALCNWRPSMSEQESLEIAAIAYGAIENFDYSKLDHESRTGEIDTDIKKLNDDAE